MKIDFITPLLPLNNRYFTAINLHILALLFKLLTFTLINFLIIIYKGEAATMQEKWIVFFQKRRAPTRPIYIMGFYNSTKHNLYLH